MSRIHLSFGAVVVGSLAWGVISGAEAQLRGPAVGLVAGTQGLGGEAQIAFGRQLTLRSGLTAFSYTRNDADIEGIAYQATLRLSAVTR